MKILVFSDSHLTDQFEIKKFNFLKKLISGSDRVIINGDFWDGQLTTFAKFIASSWNKLFPLLKSKKTVYLYGNHDLKSFCDERTNLFSDIQDLQYRLKISGKTLIFEHGNRILPLIDEQFLPRALCKYTTIISDFLVIHFPILQFVLKKADQTMKNKVRKMAKKNETYICGHSHWAGFDLENHYINTGSVRNGTAEYLWIINNDLTPRRDKYA